MLRELQDRYRSWMGHALLPAMTADARIDWPGKGSYEAKAGIFVGPDAGRWIWCPPPPGSMSLPHGFRIEGVRVSGTSSDGRAFSVEKCAPSALSWIWAAGVGSKTDVLLRVEDAELALPATASLNGPVEVRWVITNAVFNGEEMSPDPAAGPNQQRRAVIRFASPSKTWVLRLLPAFRNAEQTALAQVAQVVADFTPKRRANRKFSRFFGSEKGLRSM